MPAKSGVREWPTVFVEFLLPDVSVEKKCLKISLMEDRDLGVRAGDEHHQGPLNAKRLSR